MDPFSFNSTASYGILRIAIPRQGTIIKMDILTTKLDGLIFYVTGLSSRPDFLALQNKEGKVRKYLFLCNRKFFPTSKRNFCDSVAIFRSRTWNRSGSSSINNQHL